MDELLTVKQVADLLQLHEITIRRYIKSGRLDAVRIGRNVRVPRRAVEALLREENPALREAPPVYQTKEVLDENDQALEARIQQLRAQVEQLKAKRRSWSNDDVWDDLDRALKQILDEAIAAGVAFEGEWQGD